MPTGQGRARGQKTARPHRHHSHGMCQPHRIRRLNELLQVRSHTLRHHTRGSFAANARRGDGRIDQGVDGPDGHARRDAHPASCGVARVGTPVSRKHSRRPAHLNAATSGLVHVAHTGDLTKSPSIGTVSWRPARGVPAESDKGGRASCAPSAGIATAQPTSSQACGGTARRGTRPSPHEGTSSSGVDLPPGRGVTRTTSGRRGQSRRE